LTDGFGGLPGAPGTLGTLRSRLGSRLSRLSPHTRPYVQNDLGHRSAGIMASLGRASGAQTSGFSMGRAPLPIKTCVSPPRPPSRIPSGGSKCDTHIPAVRFRIPVIRDGSRSARLPGACTGRTPSRSFRNRGSHRTNKLYEADPLGAIFTMASRHLVIGLKMFGSRGLALLLVSLMGLRVAGKGFGVE
jgi:hypothetical protein